MSKKHSTAIVWFRRDLRLADNPALVAACANANTIIPVFIWAPEEEAPWQPGAASRWWLHHALADLQTELAQHNVQLIIQQSSNSLNALQAIIKETQADAVYWNRLYEPACIARDSTIKKTLRADGVSVNSHNGALLIEPWDIATKQQTPYRVFTPFWRTALTKIDRNSPFAVPTITMQTAHHALASATLESLNLLPKIHWDQSFYDHWQPGSNGAMQALDTFIEDRRIIDYTDARNIPAKPGTSQLSPHLHFGSISPRQINHALQAFNDEHGHDQAVDKYLAELGWREFAHHLLYHYPQTTQQPLNDKFTDFPWATIAPDKLQAWQQGQTGIPLVDAGMRELWQTGWMHNRVRMIVGSFLVKNLRYHWHHGADWFWDTLVDASLANNTLGWQWIAGCGADASPYFRVFNPETQAEKFDAKQQYIKTYVPEVNQTSYPQPIVDLKTSRQAALTAYQSIKKAD